MNRTDQTTRQRLFCLLVLAPLLLLTGCGEDSSTGPDEGTALQPAIMVGASVTPVQGRITVDTVVSDGPGWLVVHRDNGANAPVVPGIIGKVELDSGRSTTVSLQLDSVVADGEKLWLMLHEDDGVIGRYEFEGPGSPDQPVSSGTAIVMTSITIAQTDPSIEIGDQILRNNSVSVPTVSSPDHAWLVFHKNEQGGPGDVITSIRIEAGSRGESAQFPPEPSTSLRAGDTVWAMLHVDRGTPGIYEFPGPDAPMRDRSGRIVMKSFVVLPPAIQSVVVEDQTIDAGALFVLEVNSADPGWIVLHEDDGSGRPKNDKGVGWARVWSGKTTSVEVKIEAPITPGVRIWAVLHADNTPVGRYDYPESDLPVDQSGEIVADSFEILE